MIRLQVSTKKDGFHRWPGAPDTRSYLRERHHHEFEVGIAVSVGGPEREIELHSLREELDAALDAMAPFGEFGDMSCESIALAILDSTPRADAVTVNEDDRHGAMVTRGEASRPEVVTVCGSTRFKAATEQAILQLEREGKAVLSVGGFPHAEEWAPDAAEKAAFDALHKAKIRMSDSIYVVNVDGYVGHSTSEEIRLAWRLGLPVRWRYPQFAIDRGTLLWFYGHMETKLLARASKGGWLGEGLNVLLGEVDAEYRELGDAVRRFIDGPATAEKRDAVIAEAADVANRAMMVADLARTMWDKGYR